MTVPSTPLRATDASRDRILAAAARLFAQMGFQGTSFGAVAAASGQSKALVQYHFPSKDALWQASLRFIVAQRDQLLPQYLDPAFLNRLDAQEQNQMIRNLCRQLIRFSIRHPEWIRILYQEAAAPGPRLDWMIEEFLGQDLRNGKAMIEMAQTRGLLPTLDPYHLLHILSGALFHIVNIAPILQKAQGIDPCSDDAIDGYVSTLMKLL